MLGYIKSSFKLLPYQNWFESLGLRERIDQESKISVLRAGEVNQVLINQIVVGDVLQLKYGKLINHFYYIFTSMKILIKIQLITIRLITSPY